MIQTFETWIFLRKCYICDSHKMETNYDTSGMPDLRALEREHGLRGYSKLRKAELITFLWDNPLTHTFSKTCFETHTCFKTPFETHICFKTPFETHTCSKTPFEIYTCFKTNTYFKTSIETSTCSKIPFQTYACSVAFKIGKASTKMHQTPKPMRLPPPPPEDSFHPYEMG